MYCSWSAGKGVGRERRGGGGRGGGPVGGGGGRLGGRGQLCGSTFQLNFSLKSQNGSLHKCSLFQFNSKWVASQRSGKLIRAPAPSLGLSPKTALLMQRQCLSLFHGG